MSIKDAMICDIETGICGPAEESNSVIKLIDLTALSTKKEANAVTVQTEKDK
ncbi:hypothetical protein [Psychrobacillus psychrodurans]|uniref:hypothetical protein n=1 Tax=Psychrobacillus psychrodurans TaxID=126157 RepID=UPI003D089F1D